MPNSIDVYVYKRIFLYVNPARIIVHASMLLQYEGVLYIEK